MLMWILLIFPALLLVVGAILLKSKNAGMIPAYNKLSSGEKEKLNTAKLARFYGILYIALAALGAFIIVMLFQLLLLPMLAGIIAIAMATVYGLVYGQKLEHFQLNPE